MNDPKMPYFDLKRDFAEFILGEIRKKKLRINFFRKQFLPLVEVFLWEFECDLANS